MAKYALRIIFVAVCIAGLALFWALLAKGASFDIKPVQSPRTQLPLKTANMPSGGQNGAEKGQISPFSPISVDRYVRAEAIEYGVNPEIASFIVSHESQDGRNLIGDDGNSRGPWMISRIYHPEVSYACAMDLKCSTEWSLKHILAGYLSEWSTWRFRCKFYPRDNPPNCPASVI